MAQAPTINIKLEIEKPTIYIRAKEYDREGLDIEDVTTCREEAFDPTRFANHTFGLQYDCVLVWVDGVQTESWYWQEGTKQFEKFPR